MDDLLDLDWSKQSNTGQQSSNKNNVGRNNNGSSYNFDTLTRSMPTNGNVGRQQQQQSSIPVKSTTTNSSNDAFSSLLGFGATANTNNSTLSMAERLKQSQLSNNVKQTISQSKPAVQSSSTAWDGLDGLMKTGNGSTKISPKPSMVSSSTKKSTDDDIWNFGEMSSNIKSKPAVESLRQQSQRNSPIPSTSSQVVNKKPASNDPFDFSAFEDPADFQSSALGGSDEPTNKKPTRAKNEDLLFDDTNSRQNFSMPDDEYDDEGDDSILGSLTRPAQPLSSKFRDTSQEQADTRRSVNASSQRKAGTSSPPPHIIGQVVEMGFSPQQARDALSQTQGGQDVQAALEFLLHNNKSNDTDVEDRDRRLAMRLQKEEHSLRPSNRMRANDDSVLRNNKVRAGFDVDSEASRSSTPVDWQKQADQLYAQASELGANMFSKANALWSTAKTQAQRALDEHTGGGGGGSGAGSGHSSGRASPASASDRARSRRWAVPSRDGGATARKDWQGKPKWMIDAEEEEGGEAKEVPQNGKQESTFKDDDDVAGIEEAPPFFERSQANKGKASQQRVPSPEKRPQHQAENNLWGEERSNTPQTSSQRRTPVQQSPIPSSSARSRQTTAAAPSVATKRQRNIVQDDANSVQTSSQHKQRGNELFKRGAYGEAEAAYSVALNALDANPTSIRRVIILNNRANARLKNGDAKGTLDDTMSVLRLIVVQEGEKSSPFLLFRPSQEHPLPLPEYEDVNLREAYAKALLRRAQAEEMLERWDPALSVWSLLEKYEREEGSGSNGVSNMRAAKEGRGRCDKMLKGGDLEETNANKKPLPNPRVRAAAASAVAKAEAQVKERLRAENAAAAKEEATKDSLRDSIDAKILAWKTGKENNVRALLASLHDVVWPGLGWKKVGMHELVMDNQVKKVYMRAIGRLHPDKLTPKSNTIEERMLGGAVFSVLNDAWSSIQTK